MIMRQFEGYVSVVDNLQTNSGGEHLNEMKKKVKVEK